jgi:hypothetical protein
LVGGIGIKFGGSLVCLRALEGNMDSNELIDASLIDPVVEPAAEKAHRLI